MVPEDIYIASKPDLLETDGLVQIFVPLNTTPSDLWTAYFSKNYPAIGGANARIGHACLIVRAIPDQLSETLIAVEAAIADTNAQHVVGPVAEEVEAWWSEHGRTDRDVSVELHPVQEPDRSPIDETAGVPQRPEPIQPRSSSSPAPRSTSSETKRWENWALGLGIASAFLWGLIGLLPLVATAVSVAALSRAGNRSWKSWVGLGLAAIYTLMYLHDRGHLEGLFT